MTGDAVNVAARLEQNAKAGRDPPRRADGSSSRRGGDRRVRCPDLTLKGKAAAGLAAWRLISVAPTYRLLRVRSRPRSLVAVRSCAALSGRSSARLPRGAASRDRARGARDRQVAPAARGPVAPSPSTRAVLVGRCLPYGEGITYWPLVEIVKQVAGRRAAGGYHRAAQREENGDLVAELVAAAVGAGERADRRRDCTGPCAGCSRVSPGDAPTGRRPRGPSLGRADLSRPRRVRAAFSRQPDPAARQRPAGAARDAPVWVKRRPTAELARARAARRGEVERLSTRSSRAAHSRTDARRVLEAAEGNPLFVEQLLAMQAGRGDEERARSCRQRSAGAPRCAHRPARDGRACRSRAGRRRGPRAFTVERSPSLVPRSAPPSARACSRLCAGV